MATALLRAAACVMRPQLARGPRLGTAALAVGRLSSRGVLGASSSPLRRQAIAHGSKANQAATVRTMVTVRGVEVTPRRIGYVVIGGATLYLVLDGAFRFLRFYADLTIFDLGEIGFFAGGILFSTLFVGAYILTRRYGIPQPDPMTNVVLRRLRNDSLIKSRFGDSLQTGEFRAYAYKGGLSWTGYQPKRLQMIVELKGPKEAGVVSFDVRRSWREGLVFKSLCVDVNSSGERLLYAGSTDDVIFHGTIRLT